MIPFQVKASPLAGTSYKEVAPRARAFLRELGRKTKRRPYLRSAYFSKDKIFLTYFWPHLSQKPLPEQVRRLRYLPCAAELICKSRQVPETKENVDKRNELLHRFTGIAPDGMIFFVQIKQDKRNDRKELMSVFPKKP